MNLTFFARLALLLLFQYFTSVVCAQCNDSFQATWTLSGGVSGINVTHAAYTSQKDLLVCGTSNNKGVIVYFNQTSSIRWAKSFSNGSFTFITPMADGGIAVVGYLEGALLALRLDAQGNVLWTKKLNDMSSVPGLTKESLFITGLAETPDGGITVCGRKSYRRPDGAFNYRIFIFKLNGDGTLGWTRENTFGNDDEAFSLLVDNGSILVVGRAHNSSDGKGYAFLEKLNPANGVVQSLQFYSMGIFESNMFRSIEKTPTGYEIGGRSFKHFSGETTYTVLRVNNAGIPTEVKHLPIFGPTGLIDQYYHSVPLPDGSSVVWMNWWYSATQIYLQKLSTTRTAAWKYQYTRTGTKKISRVLPAGSNGALAVGHLDSKLYLLKVEGNGNSEGCTKDTLPFVVKDSLTYAVTTGAWIKTDLNFAPPYDVVTTSQPVNLTFNGLCQATLPCQLTGITGTPLVCTPDTTLFYRVQKSGSCNVQWSLSAPIGTIQTVNDSTISIRFTQAGTAQLQAEAFNSCTGVDMIQQLNINYRPTPNTLVLSPFTALCAGDTLTLSTNNVYNAVQWSTGSTANQIHVTAPGLYSLTVSNDNVCYLFASTQVTMIPKPLVQLPKDTLICRPNTITLSAGSGFSQYLWQDNSTAANYIVQNPGTYWVRVKDANGCTASDTATISRTGNVPKQFLAFKDTAICTGETLVLKLNQPFSSYDWNGGQSSTPTFTIQKPGIYTIVVSNTEGCKGMDTATIQDKNCKQQLFIPNAFSPNSDRNNDTFKARAIGALEQFELTIYNRWGEAVFHTTNIQTGRDGKRLQKEQRSDVFVYLARYKFAGQKPESQKGTLVLIR